LNSFDINIADYFIRFSSLTESIDLKPHARFENFLKPSHDYDILINVHSGNYILPSETVKVFDAPYVEEINGIRVRKQDKFWSVYKHRSNLFITTTFPLSPSGRSAVLKFSLTDSIWDLWIEGAEKDADPLEYPLDGLILYYLTAISGDIMIHASGVNYSGRGYIFSGVSGKGKTTIAKIWDDAGARVISDDRLIIRKTEKGWRMFNTPVRTDDVPAGSGIDKIYLIRHGDRNEIIPVSGAAAVSMVLSNCIQHSWDKEIIARLIGSVSFLCMASPVCTLAFRPARSVIDEILNNE
jgi:hypothetical protein